MFIVVKLKGDPVICGGITAISKETGISIDTLYYQFSRKKRKRYKRNGFIIIKTKVIRSKRKKQKQKKSK